MARVIGGIACLVALAGGIFAQVGPVDVLIRAAIAYLLGWIGTTIWYVFFTIRVRRPAKDNLDEELDAELSALSAEALTHP